MPELQGSPQTGKVLIGNEGRTLGEAGELWGCEVCSVQERGQLLKLAN